MASIPSISCMIDSLSSATLLDYDLTHDPCAAGVFGYAKRLWYLTKSGNEGSSFSYAYLRRMGIVTGQDYDPGSYDQSKDVMALGAAVCIIACVFGIIHSFAVFAPGIQHHYETGAVETILVGCLTYTLLIAMIPVCAWLCKHISHRGTCIAGMMLYAIGLLLDSLTLNVYVFYLSHLLLMALGGSMAYTASMTVCSGRFRKHLALSITLLTCAGNLGAIVVFLFSHLLTNYISYMWTKLCLTMLVIGCTAACQAFPLENLVSCHPQPGDRVELKRCIRAAMMERDRRLRQLNCEDVPKKSFNCLCICDVSVCTDFSFILWGLLCMLALSTNFVPYLYLVAKAYEEGTTTWLFNVCLVSVVSMSLRAVIVYSGDHTFWKNRTTFQLCCVDFIASGLSYIALVWATTSGWLIIWGAMAGAIEGVETVVIPRVTLSLFPYKSIQACSAWITQFHAVAVLIGPMLIMCVGYYDHIFTPAFVAIGIVQIMAAGLAYLLPDMDELEFQQLEEKYGPAPEGLRLTPTALG